MATSTENTGGQQENTCDDDEFVWFEELTEFGCEPEMYCPIPWVQYLLLLIAAGNPDAMRFIFERELEVMAASETEKVADNGRPLTLFGQLDSNSWWALAHAVFFEQRSLKWIKSWVDAKVDSLPVTAAQEFKEAWTCFRTNQEWHKVQRWESSHRDRSAQEPVSPFNPALVSHMSPTLKQRIGHETADPSEHIEVLNPDQLKLETPRFDPFSELSAWRYPYATPRVCEKMADLCSHQLWAKGMPIGMFAPPTIETWIGMTACASGDWKERYKRLLNKVEITAKESLMLTRHRIQFRDAPQDDKPAREFLCNDFKLDCNGKAFLWTKKATSQMKPFGQTTAVLWTQLRPFVKCSCFQERVDCEAQKFIVWLDCALWYMMNHLDHFFPLNEERTTHVDQVISFLGLLRQNELYVVQISTALRVAQWIHSGVRQVLFNPAVQSLSTIPPGGAKRLIEAFLIPRHLAENMRGRVVPPAEDDPPCGDLVLTQKNLKAAFTTPKSSKGKARTQTSPADESTPPAKKTKDELRTPPSRNWNRGRGKARK